MNNHEPAPVVELIRHGIDQARSSGLGSWPANGMNPAGFIVIPEARRHRPPPSRYPNFGF